MATNAFIAALRNSGGEFPGGIVLSPQRDLLNILWSYYRNNQFEDLAAWQTYRQSFELYRNIRSIYNPTRRLVNFYVAQVYPGVLSEDASRLPDGIQIAIPFSDDTEEDLKMAIAQFWEWSNWQSENKKMVKFGAATGSCLVEVVDNTERGKVSASVRWPGLIADHAKNGGPSLVLDAVGNVKFYALEYEAVDDKGETFTYRQEISKEFFTYYHNESVTEEIPNPYGFVPAVWCKHIDEGDDFGVPAISGSIGKIDELNSIVSHVHDQIDILIDSPGIIASSARIGNIGEDADAIKTRAQAAEDEFNATLPLKQKPTKRLLLSGPADSKWVPLTGNLEPDKTIPHMDRLLQEIEHDNPELGMYQELRKMSHVTGPGAARMMGDVYSRVLEVSSNYDTQSIKLFQMVAAIGGFRYAQGRDGWSLKTNQQKKFAPFSLESYERGELNIAIMPRPLIPITEADSLEMTGLRLDNAKKAEGILSEDSRLDLAGVPESERAKEKAAIDAERKAKAALIPAPKPPNGDSQFIQ